MKGMVFNKDHLSTAVSTQLMLTIDSADGCSPFLTLTECQGRAVFVPLPLPLPSTVSSNQQQLMVMDNAAATKTKKKMAAVKEKRKKQNKAPVEVIPSVRSFRATIASRQ
jgi:hypothetical protein